MSRLITSLMLLCLALWFAFVVAGAISAAVTFTVLPPLEPRIPGFDVLDSKAMGRLVAGLATEPIFKIADWAQLFFCLVLVGLLWLHPPGRWLHQRLLRRFFGGSVAAATLLLIGRAWLVQPPMQDDLLRYREAASMGNLDLAQEAVAAFEQWHHIAELLWGLTGLALLVALAMLGAHLGRSGMRQEP